ncbi:IS66 family insertion sequence element accessory protein TnpB, partial [Mesorhizobium sp. M0898]|uniref:IS66 family insertion sequence element accessory protein TnpB n=1 Tax=Mesorhizobium sp. M0898 TaxID=2957020 RepID=UPI0033363599
SSTSNINTIKSSDCPDSDKGMHYETNCGNLVKIIWHDGLGMSLYAKRLEKGRFLWPSPADGTVSISPAQLAYMLDGIDWRNPRHTFRPQRAG